MSDRSDFLVPFFSAMAVVAAAALFYVLGSKLGYWSPGLAVTALGAMNLGLFTVCRERHLVFSGTIAMAGGGLACALGSLTGVGLSVALIGGFVAILCSAPSLIPDLG